MNITYWNKSEQNKYKATLISRLDWVPYTHVMKQPNPRVWTLVFFSIESLGENIVPPFKNKYIHICYIPYDDLNLVVATIF